MYTWVLLRVRARLTRHWKNAFFFHNKKGDWSCIIHFVSIFLCKVFETSLTWLSYHLFILQGAVLCTLHQGMALWCATTLDRTRLAKFNVNKAMTLSSLLPCFITALEEFGTCSQLVFTIQSFHGQTAQVSAMNFSYHRFCCYEPWDYTFALGVLEGLITEGLMSYGAFNRNTKNASKQATAMLMKMRP